MPDSVGTRTQTDFRKSRIDQGAETRSHTRDVGMSKNVTASITFTASTGKLTAANGTFAAFGIGDQILVGLTNQNNGFKSVTAIDVTNQSFLTVDPPCKDESAISCNVRAA